MFERVYLKSKKFSYQKRGQRGVYSAAKDES